MRVFASCGPIAYGVSEPCDRPAMGAGSPTSLSFIMTDLCLGEL